MEQITIWDLSEPIIKIRIVYQTLNGVRKSEELITPRSHLQSAVGEWRQKNKDKYFIYLEGEE